MAHYKREELLYRTLWGYRHLHDKEELKDIEFVIVDDDGGRSKTFQKVIEVHRRKLNIVAAYMDEQGNNASLPMNYGIKLSSGKIIILTNPENIPYTPNILSEVNNFMKGRLDRHLACACYGLNLEDTGRGYSVDWCNKEAVQRYIDSIIFQPIRSDGRVKGAPGWRQHSKYRPGDWYFFSVIHRKPLFALRGFDEDYMKGQGREDIDLALRIRKLGMEMVRTNSLIVLHQNHYNEHSHQFAANRAAAVKINAATFNKKKKAYYVRNRKHEWGTPKTGKVLLRWNDEKCKD